MIGDLVAETRRRIGQAQPKNVTALRNHGEPLAAFSPPLKDDFLALKAFLSRRMYRHERVLQVMANAQRALSELFGAFMADPALLPSDWTAACGKPGDHSTARAVRDYVAGMTDRFLLQEYQRIFHREFPL
jgi:dGTPase